MARAKRNYINNRQFFETMREYHAQVQEAIANGTEKPRVPNYVGECLYLIATRLANKPQYYMYTFKGEMISEGIENSLKYIDNFDPTKYNNPFAYFTQVIKNAFLRRIDAERKILYHQYKMRLEGMSPSQYKNAGAIISFVQNYEEHERRKMEKSKKTMKAASNTVTTFFAKKGTS